MLMEQSLFSCIHGRVPLQFSAHSSRTGISYSPQQTLTKNTAFSGRRLTNRYQFHPSDPSKTLNYPHSFTISALQWHKDRCFDAVIDRDKKLQLFLRIRRLLLKNPTHTLLIRDLGLHRRSLLSTGLRKKRSFISLLRRFPGVIEIIDNGAYSPIIKMTEEAENLYLEEMKITDEMEDWVVIKLRKLLMMSLEKRILLKKIAHLKADLGFPDEFDRTICHRYPQYFKVVNTGYGLALELTHWDPEIAVSAVEIKEGGGRIGEMEGMTQPIVDRFDLPMGMKLRGGDFLRLQKFTSLPYISPYSDFSGLGFDSLEKEKHSCAVIHEILSLTLEKRTLVRNLTHFRYEFRFPLAFRPMLIRHPEMFYVSMKGMMNSVFLREAYYRSQLMDKDRRFLVKEKLRALVSLSVPLRKLSNINDDDDDDDDDEKEVEDDCNKKKATLFHNGRPRECW